MKQHGLGVGDTNKAEWGIETDNWFWFRRICPYCFELLGHCGQTRDKMKIHYCNNERQYGVKCIVVLERLGVLEICNTCKIRFKCLTSIASRLE